VAYRLLPMTRLGLVPYQSRLSKLFQQVNRMLREGGKVYQVQQKCFVKTERFPEGHYLFPGSLLVESETELTDCVTDLVVGGVEPYIAPLRLKRKIAFLNGKNCAAFCSDPFFAFFAAYGLDVDEISDQQVRDGVLKDYDLLIVPGGPDAGESYYEGLGEKGYDQIRSFVDCGGGYLGSCAGSYFPLSAPAGSTAGHVWLNMIPVTDVQGLDYWRTGTGFVRIQFTDTTHPVTYGLAFGVPSTLDVIYWEGPAFQLLDGNNVKVIANFQDFLASGCEPPSWDISSNEIAVEAMKWLNPLTRERFARHLEGKPAIIEAEYGRGKLILLSPHAEFGTCGASPTKEDNPNYLLLMNSLYYLSRGM
jgi:hypothetical protein